MTVENKPKENTTEDTVDKTVDSLFDTFDKENKVIDSETTEEVVENDTEVNTEESQSGSEETSQNDTETTEEVVENDTEVNTEEVEDDIPKFFKESPKGDPKEQSDMAKVAQVEYDKRQAKNANKNLEKENKAYKEIFERFQTSPLQMLREMYGNDVLTQLQTLEKDDQSGGLEQSNRAMAQRIEKLEKERETESQTQEVTQRQEQAQAEVNRYTGMLQDLSTRDEFQLARKYCEHQELDLITEASIFAGQTMEKNKDQFLEPIDALRGIQDYVKRLQTFNTEDNTNDADDTQDDDANKTTPKTKTKKKKPGTLRNEDGQISGSESTVEKNAGSTKRKRANVDKIFDAFERNE